MRDRKIAPFKLQYNETPVKPKQPIVRLKPSYYQLLEQLKNQTGLPLGSIVEQRIDYAMENMERRE